MPTGRRDSDGSLVANRHGMCKSSEYKAWAAMIQRCTNKNHPRWKQYGSRGVKVCERWLESFANFLEDMGRKTNPYLTLDRIDPEGNYEPANCRWVSFDENRRNRRGEYRITEAERERRRSDGKLRLSKLGMYAKPA